MSAFDLPSFPADDSVDTDAIQDGAVTAAKVAADVATQAELDAHASDTTSVHGITDTSALALTANVPSNATFNDHSARHENGGADEISVAGLSGELADPQPTNATKVDSGVATDGQILTADGAGGAAWETPAGGGGGGLFDAYAQLREEQPSGTSGGSFNSGSWVTRVLNTEKWDPDGIVTLASNQFTLGAGTYRIVARAPAFSTDLHQARLRNITDDATTDVSQSVAATASNTYAVIMARFTIAAQKTFEIQHRCQTTKTSNGLGTGNTFGETQFFTVVEIWRET